MDKLQIIYELFEGKNGYINNPEARAVGENSFGSRVCLYQTDDDRKCAVGRCLTVEGLALANNQVSVYTVDGEAAKIGKELDDFLYKRYRGHSTYFWDNLQHLHDSATYWDEEKGGGFNEKGKEKLENLKKDVIEGKFD